MTDVLVIFGDVFIGGLGLMAAVFGIAMVRLRDRPRGAPPSPPGRPPHRALIGSLAFMVGCAAVGWLGVSEPMRIWTRLGSPTAHGFAVGALGFGAALMFGANVLSLYQGYRWLAGKKTRSGSPDDRSS